MTNDRLFLMVPNVAFHKVVMQYAAERGKVVLTLKDQLAALENYIVFARTKN